MSLLLLYLLNLKITYRISCSGNRVCLTVFPYKHIFLREDKTPWFTDEIYECIRKRVHYVKLFRKTGNSDVLLYQHFSEINVIV